MNYELIALAVTILAAMGAGFAWLSHQMKDVRDELKADVKDVRDELKTDIKRVEDKLDNKEKEPRQEFRSAIEKIIAQACENLGNSIRAGRIDIYSLEANLRSAFDKLKPRK